MKIVLTADTALHIANADGVAVYEGKAGDTLTVPADIAALIIGSGQATPAAAEKASKAKGETNTK